MAIAHNSKLEADIRRWIKKNKKEDKRLEFKQRVDLSAKGAKAEFIRDVIALANSDGECPREDGHLVLGFNNGKIFDTSGEHYDGAKFSQIIHSNVFPLLDVSYEEFSIGGRGPHSSARIGVLILRPNSNALYVVNKRFLDESGKVLLLPGQSWGRRADRKVEMGGEEIEKRVQEIIERRIERVAVPLRDRIEELEQESGPALDVKRIRFEMEATQEWPEIHRLLLKLFPYAKEFEFSFSVKTEVVYAVSVATDRTRDGMPADVAEAVSGILLELMPLGLGGLVSPSHKEISTEDQKLLKWVEGQAWDLMWDACRYLRDIEVVRIGGRCYHNLIRFTALNGLKALHEEFLGNARRCCEICKEERRGITFPAGLEVLEELIKDALDLPVGRPGRLERLLSRSTNK